MSLGAAIGAVAGVGAAVIGSKSASDAADAQQEGLDTASQAQLQAQREALDFYREQYGITQEILSPYYNIDPNSWVSDKVTAIDQQIADLKSRSIADAGEYDVAAPTRETYEARRSPFKPGRVQYTQSDEEWQTAMDEYNAGKAEWEASRLDPNDPAYAEQLAALETQKQGYIDDPTSAMPTSPYYQQLAMTGVLGPEAEQRSIEGLMDSPYAQYLQAQGEGAIDRRASATGQLGGSERLKQISTFNQNLTNQFMNERFNQLGALTGVGLSAGQAVAGIGSSSAAGQAQVATNTGNQLANLAMQGGNAAAANSAAQGQIWGNTLADFGGMAMGYMTTPQQVQFAGGGTGYQLPFSNQVYGYSNP